MSSGAGGGLNVVGGVFSAYAAQEEGVLNAQQALAQANLKRSESKEILDRAVINEKSLKTEGDILLQNQQSGYARGNVGVGGSPLLMMENTAAKVKEEISLMNREAQFRADQLEAGAKMSEQDAANAREAGNLKMYGSLLNTTTNFASSSEKLNQGSSYKSSSPQRGI